MSETMELVLQGEAQPGQALRYLHLPFEVPEGIGRIEVAYEYSEAIGSDPHLRGGNTVDIGIFDARGAGFMTEGFRGWSGSARRSFFLAAEEATPGYMPGPIQPGSWHICLGLYKVADSGCRYRVTIRLYPEEGERQRPAQFPARLALRTEAPAGSARPGGWYKGELHCHTVNSDGDSEPEEIVRLAEALGLDFLAVTDHNTLAQQVCLNELETRLILIPGFEVTTFRGHWNVWGDQGWLDFRILREAQMAAAIQEAVRRGYLVSCNHPRPFGPAWEYEQVGGYHCVEVWNGPWELLNQVSLDFWEQRLRSLGAGQRLAAVGGSDTHFLKREHPAKLGQPTTWIFCRGEPSAAALLDGLRAGHAFISHSPAGPQLYLEAGGAMMGDIVPRPENGRLVVTLRAVDAAGLGLELVGAGGVIERYQVEENGQRFEAEVEVSKTGYVRAQLVADADSAAVRALTNPIYIGAEENRMDGMGG